MRARTVLVSLLLSLGGCGGAVAPLQCGGLTNCGGVCTSLATDNKNCGVCAIVCPNGSVCTAGQCVVPVSFPHLGQPGGGVPNNIATYHIDAGASTIVQPGGQAGYGITANVGGAYRLVWTGDGQRTGVYREFWGSVYSPGHFTQIVAGCAGGFCSLQPDDQVTAAQTVSGGQRVDFDSIAADTINGFDFDVDVDPVYFDLFIDGMRYPMVVFFPSGGQPASIPGTIPFGLTTQ